MAKSKKKVDPIKQREKRAKIAAAAGGVLFLIVAAVEVPAVMKMMNQKPPQPAASATTVPTTTTATGATSQLADVSAPSTPAPAAGGLVDTDVPPQPSNDQQLVSFSLFQTKNPFTPQVSTTTGPTATVPTPGPSAGPTPSATTPTTPTVTTPAPTQTTPTSTAPTSTVSVVPPAPSSTTTTQAPVQTAAVSVNGVVSHVGVNGTFPNDSPVFRLISWTKSSAQVSIVGGSYASGDATLTIQVGVPVTLENQTDGKRYKLLLLSTP